MEMNNLDKIYIKDLILQCIIGTKKIERKHKQDIIINIVMYADLSKACVSDSLKDTVNYFTVKENIAELVENSTCFLLENLAEKIAGLCLKETLVKKVSVTLEKTKAVQQVKSVGIEIIREK